jgi:aspartate/methionine/tyrosine aminotransferase
LARCEEFQARLLARLRGNLCKLKGALHIQGGWYAVVPLEKSRTDAEWALHLLNHHNVLVQPGYFYDFAQESIVVVSLLTKEDDFAHGIAVLGNN